ncbi:MAG: hypothetical protein B5M55_00270 [Desulfococcus sp. 4484_242]|nr:MAG: hypothetical protein B5M55_00270 [Desulfococcus sp. 4484_242]
MHVPLPVFPPKPLDPGRMDRLEQPVSTPLHLFVWSQVICRQGRVETLSLTSWPTLYESVAGRLEVIRQILLLGMI